MRAAVFAYSELGCICLEELLKRGVDVVCVVTHPDSAHENIWFRSVAGIARSHNIKVYELDSVPGPEWKGILASHKPDVVFSFMFRVLISEDILSAAKGGAFNLHPSLLPKYRGRAPANWVLVNGEKETGLTLHTMVSRADAGAIVAQCAVPIGPDDDINDLNAKFAAAAPALLAGALPGIEKGDYPRVPQDEASATKFGRRTPADGVFWWSWQAARIHNLVRAVTSPLPGAFCVCEGEKLLVWKTASPKGGGAPAGHGTIISEAPLAVATGGGSIELLSLQWEGEPRMDAADFLRIYNLKKGDSIWERRIK